MPSEPLQFAQWLWDLLPTDRFRAPVDAQPAPPVIVDAPPPPPANPAGKAKSGTKQELYDQIVEDMKKLHGVRIRKWRSNTSGVAWQVEYADGTTARLIEAPYPRGPVSVAINPPPSRP